MLDRAIAVIRTVACGSLVVWSVACGAGTDDSIETARVAVRANPSLELVATDERQGVLTVRVLGSGRLLTVKAADVVAGTAFRDLEVAAAPAASQQRGASVSAAPLKPTGDPPAIEDRVTVSRPGGNADISIARSGDRAVVETPGAQVSVNRAGASAPGSTARVVTGDRAPVASGARAEGSEQAAASTQQKGAVIDESRLERRTTPVSCVGRQVVTLRNVLLKSDAIAVAVSGDCEVRIQDSHISGQIGLQVAGGGTVSITNSIVEGSLAMQLTPPAVVTVKSSTIRGQIQRVGNVSVKDEGGNVWR